MATQNRNRRSFVVAMLITTVSVLCGSTTAWAQQVTASLSVQEAFVDSRVILEINIANAKTFTPPEIPEIDGLRVQSAGAPSRSSNLRIVNGRRSSSTNTRYSFLIYPEREGTFEIPSITLSVDGKTQSTEPQTLAVTKSETGDLMFVEATSDVEKVFVGQPLDLKLTIWIRPFTDKDNRVRLSEGNMWSFLSENSNWGPFEDRMKELNSQNTRPGGREVLKKDSEGVSRSYYAYEIEATTYPKRSGEVSAEGIRIVAEYPTKLARSRSAFGGSFFGRASFSIAGSRPISAETKAPAVEIVDVPSKGQPANYRGAVGKYRLAVQADPTELRVGEPISLKIVIQGDGPMELVEAPPIAETFSPEFKVENKSLAGFVQDDVKAFVTLIRPTSESVTSIPPLGFSFFDPKTESYETVYSTPIPIVVLPNESLSLDSIVAAKRGGQSQPMPGLFKDRKPKDEGAGLVSVATMTEERQSLESGSRSYWAFLFAPLAALVGLLIVGREQLLTGWRRKVDPLREAKRVIRNADVVSEIRDALSTVSHLDGINPSEVKKLQLDCDRHTFGPANQESRHASLQRLKEAAMQLIPIIMLCLLLFTCNELLADEPKLLLSQSQTKTLLEEAHDAHQLAIEQKKSKPAGSQANLETAIRKYELVAESGLRSAGLYRNLGDAYVQDGKFGRAVAAFEKANAISPDSAVRTRLNEVRAKLSGDKPSNFAPPSLTSFVPVCVFWWAAIVSWTCLWALAVGMFLKPLLRHPAAIASCVGLLCVAAVCLWLARDVPRMFDAISVVDKAELRAADGEEFSVTDVVELGEPLSVRERRGGWMLVQASESEKTGWMKASELTLVIE